MKTLIAFLLIPVCSLAADPSPLCENLSRFACSPGTQKDGTGSILGDDEIQAKMEQIKTKVRIKIRERLKEEFSKPENSYFKQVAVASLGLKNAPECNSPSSQSICEKNLIEGTAAMMEKFAMNPLKPPTILSKVGNFREQSQIFYQDSFQRLLAEVSQTMKSELTNPALEKKIGEKIFPDVKALIVKKLQSLPIQDKEKQLMIEKIQNIRFTGTECSKLTSPNQPGVYSLVIPNAYYSPESNTFTYCNGFNLKGDSEFAIAHTIAHELGHSIDPCHIADGPEDFGFKYSRNKDRITLEKEYPIPNIITCLRSENSVGALTPKELNQQTPANPAGGAVGGGWGMPAEGSKKDSKPGNPFCNGDQIGETVSDWLATEILPDYIESHYKLTPEQYRIGYSNTFRGICNLSNVDNAQEGYRDPHPSDDKRIDRIILVHPRVRAQMKCPPKHSEGIYCNPLQLQTGKTAPDSASAKQNMQPGVR